MNFGIQYPAEENIRLTGFCVKCIIILSRALADVGRLRALLAFCDFEFDRVAFLQALVALRSDCAVVYKNVGTISAPDEPVSLCVVEPLDRAFQTFHVPTPSFRTPSVGDPKDVPT